MLIRRLKLENWKGVESREIELDEGVTIIEGPNEIGKTTLVEALRMLFRTLDSSKSKEVKAVQPVGQDVGSRVEAEIETGDYRFVYAKRFNRDPETTLHISAPKTSQFTGRQAHEKAEEILEQTVDLALWAALLVDQGKDIAQANLKDSQGLAKSLDEAAGSSGSGYEDSGLIAAVEAEFSKYFTPTGQHKSRPEEVRLKQAVTELENARAALAAIETDAVQYEHQSKEVLRLQQLIPELHENVTKHKVQWTQVQNLKAGLEAKEKELKAAREVLQSARDAEAARATLIEENVDLDQKIGKLESALGPLSEQVEKLTTQRDQAQEALKEAKNERRETRAALRLAEDDQHEVHRREARQSIDTRLEQLKKLAVERQEALDAKQSSKVDDDGLERIRTADNQLLVASGKRETAATRLTVQAESDITFLASKQEIMLEAGDVQDFEVVSKLEILFPGVAGIAVKPPESAEELDIEFGERQAALDALLHQYEVPDYPSAVVSNQARQSAERELQRIYGIERHLLEGSSLTELEQSQKELKQASTEYAKNRQTSPAMPAGLGEAAERVKRLADATVKLDESIEEDGQRVSEIERERDEKNVDLQVMRKEVSGLEAARNEKRTKLEAARTAESDEALVERVADRSDQAEELEVARDQLLKDLANASSEAVEAKYTNAQQAHDRAQSELQSADRALAILTDRLEQARANGRYEALESAEREQEESGRIHREVTRRAAAAKLLWDTLSAHRDTTRKAYVLPLKERIERLGEIVFGSGCQVEIDDSWQLVSRTLDGKTIPFENLSVGAREQLGILARLAAAQIVSTQSGVPLIIDDALGFSDPFRLEAMGAAISRAGQDCQILLMTCSPGRFTHVGSAKLIKVQ